MKEALYGYPSRDDVARERRMNVERSIVRIGVGLLILWIAWTVVVSV